MAKSSKPTKSNLKREIKAYMDENGIEYTTSMTKKELLKQIDSKKSSKKKSSKKSTKSSKKPSYKKKTDDVFYLSNGITLSSLYELVETLDSLSDDIFHHHVNEHKNDFAAWVERRPRDGRIGFEDGA